MTDFPSAPPKSSAAAFFASLRDLGVAYAGASGKGGTFRCPIHEDERPSLDVFVTDRGKVVFTCTPCRQAMGQEAYAEALRSHGVKWSGTATDPASVDWGAPCVTPTRPSVQKKGTSGGEVRLTAVHRYRFEDGSDNFKVRRFDPVDPGASGAARKFFAPMRWEHGWVGKAGALDGVERTPYYLERFEQWAGGVLYLVEGEKAADALVSAGKAATTFHGGAAGKLEDGWVAKYRFNRFRYVRVWPDADEAGVMRARQLVAELQAGGVNAGFYGAPADEVQAKDDAYDVLAGSKVQACRTLSEDDLDALAALAPMPRLAGGAERPSEPLARADKALVPASGYEAAEGGEEPAPGPELPKPYGTSVNVDPWRFAEEMLEREFCTDDDVLTLRFRHDDRTFWLWNERKARYTHLTEDEVKARVARILARSLETNGDGEVRPVKIKARTYGELVEVMRPLTLTSEHGAGSLLPSVGGVPFRNGWLNVETGALEPVGPERDIRWNVPADYDDKARCPEWFKFLDSLGWTKETEERRLLRQWFGYLLSGSTAQQKAMLLLGPKRAGKGTILSVAEGLLGEGAVGTQLDAFASNFGMQNLIGKGLATIGDARFGFKTDKKVVERILSLTSGDTMTIDVKHKDPLSVRLGARLMIATNESPKFIEASDALATRFLVLQFNQTFYGHEDLNLRRRVLKELPGIARWALAGYKELLGLGSFSETTAGLGLQEQMIRDAAPIRVFVEEQCDLGTEEWVESQRLFTEYLLWAEQNNMFKMDRTQFFRDLNTAYPGQVADYYKRVGGKQTRCKRGIGLK